MTDQTPAIETATDATPEREVIDEQATNHDATTSVVDDAEVTEDATESEHDDEQTSDKPTNEAAKYRRRLRETEAERDTLKATLEGLQRSEVERLAGERLAQPGDLLEYGMVPIADLLNEEGQVEPERVTHAIDAMLESRPGLIKPEPRQKYPSGIGLGSHGPITASGRSWQDVISGGGTLSAN